MTEECRIKYIQYLQCKYSDLAQSLTNKAKLGRKCKDLETRMLVVRDYIKSLYCYKGSTPSLVVYRMEIIDPGFGLYNSLSVSFTLNTTIGIIFNGVKVFGFPMTTVLNNFASLTGLPDGFQVTVDTVNNYVYFYSETADPNTTTLNGSAIWDTEEEGQGSTPFPVTLISSGEDVVLDLINCLTTKEICTMVNHAFKLVEDCNC